MRSNAIDVLVVDSVAALTPRERSVLALLGEGLSNRRIADTAAPGANTQAGSLVLSVN